MEGCFCDILHLLIFLGIVMTYDRYSGKPKGEAFVAFIDDESASKALAKNKEYIQHRYCSISRFSILNV